VAVVVALMAVVAVELVDYAMAMLMCSLVNLLVSQLVLAEHYR
jgi:hypothetical protein